jgi:hypothetical protein
MRGELLPQHGTRPCRYTTASIAAADLQPNIHNTNAATSTRRFNHGRRITSQHVFVGKGVPQAGGRSRRQADPQHMYVTSMYEVHMRHIYTDFVRQSSDQGRLKQFVDAGQYREQGLVGKLNEAVASGTDWVELSVYSPRTSHARSSTRPPPTPSTPPKSARLSALPGRRIGSESSSRSPSTCWRRSTSSSSGTPTTRA